MRFGPRQSGSARRGIICDRCHGQSGRRQRMSDRTRILALVAALGVAYFGSTILLLSLLTADYNPISEAASDYGVGRFALEMNLGFLIGGIGLVSLALALFPATNRSNVQGRPRPPGYRRSRARHGCLLHDEPRRGSSHLARNNSRFWRAYLLHHRTDWNASGLPPLRPQQIPDDLGRVDHRVSLSRGECRSLAQCGWTRRAYPAPCRFFVGDRRLVDAFQDFNRHGIVNSRSGVTVSDADPR